VTGSNRPIADVRSARRMRSLFSGKTFAVGRRIAEGQTSLWIAHVTVADEKIYSEYRKLAANAVVAHGGEFLARVGLTGGRRTSVRMAIQGAQYGVLVAEIADQQQAIAARVSSKPVTKRLQ